MSSICFGQSVQKSTNTTQFKAKTINSNWEFYWEKLMTPEDFKTSSSSGKFTLDSWANIPQLEAKSLVPLGYATYRTTFSLPKDRPHTSLYIPSIYSASKTWINGKLISEIGRVGTTKATTIHRRTSQIIPLDDHDTTFEIVIQVANFYHHKGGIDKPLIVDATDTLQTKKTKRVIADMIFIGSLSFVGLFFLLFFLLYWNKDRAVLFFAILCLSLSYMALSDRYAPLAVAFESVSWILLTKIEYVSLFLAGLSASLFFYTIFIKFVPKMYKKIIVYGFYILSALAVLLPAPYFTQFVLPFLLLMILNLVYVSFIIIKAIANQRRESILLLTSMVLAAFIFFAHIFIFLGNNGNAIIYVNFGYIVAFLLLSMLLMTRFSDSFHALEKAQEVTLAQKKEISEQSEELSKVNAELKENVRQLRSYNEELDKFNHIVSHDLKAPLVSMHSLVSFIEEDLEVTINEQAQAHFEALKGRITKMYALINGLLEYSRIAQGNKTKTTFKLNDLLTEISEIVDPEKKHHFYFPKENKSIHTSKIELEHVFLNLMGNAIKHCDKDVAVIHVMCTELSDKYQFSIRDNGPGIPLRYHAKIFDMFYRLKDYDEKENSTGIGLTIVKKIVSDNHGKISVQSKDDIGTTITFSWKA
jgi:signal transduction histidine kinase